MLKEILPTPPFKATINGWPAKVVENEDGSITITAKTLGFKITKNK